MDAVIFSFSVFICGMNESGASGHATSVQALKSAILGFSLAHAFHSIPDDICIAAVDQDSEEAAFSSLKDRLSEELSSEAVAQLWRWRRKFPLRIS